MTQQLFENLKSVLDSIDFFSSNQNEDFEIIVTEESIHHESDDDSSLKNTIICQQNSDQKIPQLNVFFNCILEIV